MPRARKLGKFRPPFVKRAIALSACLASTRVLPPKTNFRNELIGGSVVLRRVSKKLTNGKKNRGISMHRVFLYDIECQMEGWKIIYGGLT